MKTILVDSKRGKFKLNPHDTIIGRSLKTYGEYAEHEMMLLTRFKKRGQTIIDVGANIGTHAVFFSKLVGTKGSVFAIEAQSEVFDLLNKNVNLNNLTNVETLNAAVGAMSGNIHLPPLDYNQDGNFGAFSFRVRDIENYLPMDNAGVSREVSIITVDEKNLNACDLIKIDVEGMEKEVLDGATKTIQKFRSFLYLENNNRASSPELLKLLDKINYRSYWHVISYFWKDNFAKHSDNIFSAPLELN